MAVLAAIGVGLVTNELFDLAPWLARRLLRRAARLEAGTPDETPLILEELTALLDEVPGKLTKLLWALGRHTNAVRLVKRRRSADLARPAALAAAVREDRPRFVPVFVLVVPSGASGGQSLGWTIGLIVAGSVLLGVMCAVWRRVWRVLRSRRA